MTRTRTVELPRSANSPRYNSWSALWFPTSLEVIVPSFVLCPGWNSGSYSAGGVGAYLCTG